MCWFLAIFLNAVALVAVVLTVVNALISLLRRVHEEHGKSPEIASSAIKTHSIQVQQHQNKCIYITSMNTKSSYNLSPGELNTDEYETM